MTNKKVIILDFEGVVFKTRLRGMYEDLFRENGKTTEELDYFLKEIFKEEYRSKNSNGKTITEMTEPLAKQHPEWAYFIEAFNPDKEYYRFLDGLVEGIEPLMKQISLSDNYELYGLTNWVGEGFYELKKKHPDIFAYFKKIIVSCEVVFKKPNPEIFQYTQEIMGNPDPKNVYFFDDKKRNTDAAEQIIGWNCIHFKSADDLKRILQ